MTSTQCPAWVEAELARLRAADMLRRIPAMDHGADKFLLDLESGGRPLLNLASNNYLGLAGHPALRAAACRAVEDYGTSSGASRLVTGTYALYERLERAVAAFKDQEAALVVGSGYAANVAILSALADAATVVFSDKLNHASIVDGIRVSGAHLARYRHNDMAHLARLLEREAGRERKLLITDTVFSMDGDVAPLAEIVELCRRHDVLLAVDEAHGAGVFGNGRGVMAQLGLPAHVHMGTFSKALGSQGAYVAGCRQLVDLIANRGRAFVFSTALPPAVIGANLAAVEHVAGHPEEGRRLLAMAEDFRTFLRSLGFGVADSASQVIPILLGDNAATLRARDLLMDHGLYVAAVRPPTVPAGTARLRVSLRADLTDADLELARAGFLALREAIPEAAK